MSNPGSPHVETAGQATDAADRLAARARDRFASLPILPRMVPIADARAPQANIPPTKPERTRLRDALRTWLETQTLVPPIPLDEIRRHTEGFLEAHGFDAKYREFAAVLLNNELWRETVAAIPYERRLLLMPKCLRVEAHCPAPFDEFGLLCKKCGQCSIQDLQDAAEKLGYAVLVAEGSPIVMAIIETGKIDAIVGVSCLSVLERAFPYMEAGAVPGVAIPLLQDDCVDTTVDEDWIWDVIHLTSEDRSRRLDLSALRDEVDSWFAPERLAETLGTPTSHAETVGHEWLARAGKRWRPFLTVAVRQALAEDTDLAEKDRGELPAGLREVAIAVECFHKASLIHDDIEDGDDLRYGQETLAAEHGTAVALNVGDWLIGEGYRLLAECDAPAEVRIAMTQVAARGHRTLCVGQGAELAWAHAPGKLSSLEVIDIFRKKTAPAFEVALRLGALYSGREDDESLRETIERYSDSLGIAYQIRDDRDDLAEGAEASDLAALRPTLPLALAAERAKKGDRDWIEALWRRELPTELTCANGHVDTAELRARLETLGVTTRLEELYEAYKEDAIRSLWDLENPSLKGLLRRVIGKIFHDTEIQGWCHEFEARNAADREDGAHSAA